jgi:hypothetical protein
MSKENEQAKAMVLGILKHEALANLDFKLNKRHVQPKMYKLVAQAIEAGQITVLFAPNFVKTGSMGIYLPEIKFDSGDEWYDVLALRFYDLGSTANEVFLRANSIMHECTHAGFDMLKLKKMSHLEHEAGAYIAATIFLIATLKTQRLLGGARIPDNPIGKAAWEIALLELADKRISKRQYNALFDAIGQNENYKPKAEKMTNNDGVGKDWIIKKSP